MVLGIDFVLDFLGLLCDDLLQYLLLILGQCCLQLLLHLAHDDVLVLFREFYLHQLSLLHLEHFWHLTGTGLVLGLFLIATHLSIDHLVEQARVIVLLLL